jgi:hypothetical protein
MTQENHRVERSHVYVGEGNASKLVAEITSSDVTITTNNEQAHALDGSNYFSIGNPVVETTFQTVTPVDGYSFDLLNSIISQSINVAIVHQLADKLISTSGTWLSAGHKSDSKTGMLTGDFKHQGGKPTYL